MHLIIMIMVIMMMVTITIRIIPIKIKNDIHHINVGSPMPMNDFNLMWIYSTHMVVFSWWLMVHDDVYISTVNHKFNVFVRILVYISIRCFFYLFVFICSNMCLDVFVCILMIIYCRFICRLIGGWETKFQLRGITLDCGFIGDLSNSKRSIEESETIVRKYHLSI